MGQDSSIEWTDHTFNIVWGCQRVSPGCERCYAQTWAERYGYAVWGPAKTTPRRVLSDAYWKQPLKWNRDAERLGERKRVFCCSMADVFEEHPTTAEQRLRLWPLIEATPMLDWLLLTKRPQSIRDMLPREWLDLVMPSNVWLGTSVEDQQRADERIPHLLRVPAAVRFLSCEPLLGAVDLSEWLDCYWDDGIYDQITGRQGSLVSVEEGDKPGIHWAIVGGESGHGARPMHPDWARSLRDQATGARVAFLFKQWGEYEPYEEDAQPPFWQDQHGRLHDGHWLDVLNPETGEVNHGWHEDSLHTPYAFRRVGKHAAGRLLDGRTWDEFPQVAVECK